MKWKKKVAIKHLFCEEEDHISVQNSMDDVADVLEEAGFPARLITPCRDIPLEYSILIANSLIDKIFDYADMERIWID